MGRIDGNAKGTGKGTESKSAGVNEKGEERVKDGGASAFEPRIDAAERLTMELARLRAKFGADPAIARASLEDAWMSPTAGMEEDEAEFIDAVADCLGVGLSLDAALTCWDSGGMFYDAEDEEGDEPAEVSLPAVAAHHASVTGRRLVIP